MWKLGLRGEGLKNQSLTDTKTQEKNLEFMTTTHRGSQTHAGITPPFSIKLSQQQRELGRGWKWL